MTTFRRECDGVGTSDLFDMMLDRHGRCSLLVGLGIWVNQCVGWQRLCEYAKKLLRAWGKYMTVEIKRTYNVIVRDALRYDVEYWNSDNTDISILIDDLSVVDKVILKELSEKEDFKFDEVFVHELDYVVVAGVKYFSQGVGRYLPEEAFAIKQKVENVLAEIKERKRLEKEKADLEEQKKKEILKRDKEYAQYQLLKKKFEGA